MPIQQIVQKYPLSYHKYADDIQLYISYDPAKPDDVTSARNILQNCIYEIKEWMSQNYLKLNDSKTDLINIMSPYHKRVFGNVSIVLDGCVITPSHAVKNLGVVFDDNLSMDRQVSSIVKKCSYHLRNIGRIRRYITTAACKTVVQSLVISQIDYCSTLLAGVPQNRIRRLQIIQNKAARIISRAPKADHITPILAELHWLPCQQRLHFRILTYVYKSLHHLAPIYLENLISAYRPGRALRSAGGNTLVRRVPRKKIGGQSFFTAGPNLWNSIPQSIRDSPSLQVFKRTLKTYLFKCHFQ